MIEVGWKDNLYLFRARNGGCTCAKCTNVVRCAKCCAKCTIGLWQYGTIAFTPFLTLIHFCTFIDSNNRWSHEASSATVKRVNNPCRRRWANSSRNGLIMDWQLCYLNDESEVTHIVVQMRKDEELTDFFDDNGMPPKFFENLPLIGYMTKGYMKGYMIGYMTR